MFKDKFKIEFVSTIDGLDEIEECKPVPSNKRIPSWWREVPKPGRYPEVQNVKVCPSFPDYFSQGYIIPMWADTVIRHDKNTGNWEWLSGRPAESNPFNISIHSNKQMLDYVSPTFTGSEASIIFKFDCPWRVITPKGYSVLQLPMFYNFKNDFSVMPGIIDTDRHHEINQQVLYHGNGEEVFIERGTPIAQYIPFKRTKYNYLVRSQTNDDFGKFLRGRNKLNSLFPGRHSYKKDL